MADIDKFWLTEDGRLYAAMHTLIYPGVLGSLIYAVPDKMSAGQSYSNETLLLGGAFALAFAFDYIHSAGERFKNSYTFKLFALDLVIVVMLFGAGQRILGNDIFAFFSVPAMLAISKFAAALWEVCADTSEDSARNTDFLLCAVYSGIAVTLAISASQCWNSQAEGYKNCSGNLLIALGIALLADAASFFYYKKVARWWPNEA